MTPDGSNQWQFEAVFTTLILGALWLFGSLLGIIVFMAMKFLGVHDMSLFLIVASALCGPGLAIIPIGVFFTYRIISGHRERMSNKG